jgi:AraC family transcriptional regulator
MEPTIVECDQIILVGMSFFGDPFASSGGWTEENEIGRLWGRFMAYLEEHGDRIRHVVDRECGYEVHIEHPDTAAKGHYEVFAGVEVSSLEQVPAHLLVKFLPPSQYAVFTLTGEEITSDWARMIYHDWMPESGYEQAHQYAFQVYDERFKGMEQLAASVLDLYIPVKPP